MTKEEIVCSLFVLTNKLKDVVKRKGWYKRNINRKRVESVADHIYGSQMVAYTMYSEFKYDVDINKVILMLAIHEIGETIIGDKLPKEKKQEVEEEAVLELLKLIPNGDYIKELYIEYEKKETKEAKFAYDCEHAECDLQAKLYVEEGCFSHNYDNYTFIDEWIGYDRKRLPYDKNFDDLLEYISNNDIKIMPHQDNPIQNVISFYSLTNKLKDKQRTGEVIWNLNKEKYGSIAEHIYSVEMLELIIYLVYNQDIDISKVISITSVHELGEIVTGDIDALTKTNEDRNKEYNVAKSIASILTKSDIILSLLEEYHNMKTKEAIYVKSCDKLVPGIISKIYDQLNLIDLNNQEGNKLLNNPIVKKYLARGDSFSSMWLHYGQEVYKYQEPFMSISEYAIKNNLDEPYSKTLAKKLGIEVVK